MTDGMVFPPPGAGPNTESHQLIARLASLELRLSDMQFEIHSLKEENATLRRENLLLKPKPPVCQYETDEDELANETNWILQKRNPKKRKAASSPDISPQKVEDTSKKNKNNSKSTLRPPPIMVSNVEEYKQFYNFVQKEAKDSFTVKILNNNISKINVISQEDYRSVTSILNAKNIAWYSYENKQTRPIKVVVRNLHHSWTSEDVVENLKAQNFRVISAINKLKFKTKEPLDMFLVSFESAEDIKRI